MEFDTLSTVLWFLVVLSIIVFVHEWGHYWVARRNGVRVEVFSIGFGPEIFGWFDKSGTRWRVSAVPLGGYVKMFGMVEDGDNSAVNVLEKGAGSDSTEQSGEMSEADKAVSFAFKTVGQRAAIVFAGPAMKKKSCKAPCSAACPDIWAIAIGPPRSLKLPSPINSLPILVRA